MASDRQSAVQSYRHTRIVTVNPILVLQTVQHCDVRLDGGLSVGRHSGFNVPSPLALETNHNSKSRSPFDMSTSAFCIFFSQQSFLRLCWGTIRGHKPIKLFGPKSNNTSRDHEATICSRRVKSPLKEANLWFLQQDGKGFSKRAHGFWQRAVLVCETRWPMIR